MKGGPDLAGKSLAVSRGNFPFFGRRQGKRKRRGPALLNGSQYQERGGPLPPFPSLKRRGGGEGSHLQSPHILSSERGKRSERCKGGKFGFA